MGNRGFAQGSDVCGVVHDDFSSFTPRDLARDVYQRVSYGLTSRLLTPSPSFPVHFLSLFFPDWYTTGPLLSVSLKGSDEEVEFKNVVELRGRGRFRGADLGRTCQ